MQIETHFIFSREHSQRVKQIHGWVGENWLSLKTFSDDLVFIILYFMGFWNACGSSNWSETNDMHLLISCISLQGCSTQTWLNL